MQQRYDDPLDVAVEVRPSFVLKADLFEKWRATGEEGRRKIDAALDRAVTEIIDKYQIAERTSAGNLRSWIGQCVEFYFNHKAREESRVPEAQARERWARIEGAVETLLKEIPVHWGLDFDFQTHGPSRDRDDPYIGIARVEKYMTQLKEIREYTKRTHESRRQMLRKRKGRNAAKPALAQLGETISWGWICAWVSPRDTPHDALEAVCYGRWVAQDQMIAAGSKYVRFATYLYAFIGEPCSEPGVIMRLKAAEPKESSKASKKRR